MARKTKEQTLTEMWKGFDSLSSSAKVELLADFYYSLYDGEKDNFLRKTENA